jgi:hypothetical protein
MQNQHFATSHIFSKPKLQVLSIATIQNIIVSHLKRVKALKPKYQFPIFMIEQAMNGKLCIAF